MQPPSAPERPRRSAFAAAFFSFVFPGLGQAYLGRWDRALGWARASEIGVIVGAGTQPLKPEA